MRRAAACLALLLTSLAVAGSETWTIGVAGAWGTGYMGLLARNGMPRERLLGSQLRDPEVLRRFRVLIVAGPVEEWDAAVSVVEEYVRGGGCALLEYSAFPTPAVIPGERLSPQAGPNLLVETANPTMLPGLAAGRTFENNGAACSAIDPPDGGTVTVLARYTEAGAADKVRGVFVRNGRSVPALLYTPLGRGHLVYSGPWMGWGLAMSHGGFADLVFSLLRFLTQGNVVPRMALAGPETLLTARIWAPAGGPPAEAPAQASVPEGYAVLEGPAAEFQEYDVRGKLTGEADLLLDYAAATQYLAVHLRADGAQVALADGGPETPLAVAGRATAPPGSEVVVARRRGGLRLYLNGRLAAQAADRGQWAGAVAVKGLADAAVQPVEAVEFADDFMREAGEQAEWTVVSGSWQVVSSEGSPQQGANPFSYGVEAQDPALATTGEWFWDDYRVEASARWTQNVAGLAFHYRDPASYDLLEADLAAQALRLVRMREGKSETLKEAPVSLRPWQWYRLGVAAASQTIVATVDGQPVLAILDSTGGRGPVGLYTRGSKAAFDDVEVVDWRAFAGPPAGELANWRPVAGKWEASGDESFVARGGGDPDLLQAAGEWADCEADVEVRLGKAQRAGLRVRGREGRGCDAAIERAGTGYQLRLVSPGAGGQPDARSVPLKAFKADAWHRLSVRAIRDFVSCALDDQPLLGAPSDSLPREGSVALLSVGGAEFREAGVRPVADDGLRPVDPRTPAYAGAVDVITWATPAGTWFPDPADLALFWHEGSLSGDLRLRVGVRKGADAVAAGRLLLAPPGGSGADGYDVAFRHTWGTPGVTVTLAKAGKELGRGTYEGEMPAEGFLMELERRGSGLACRVNGRTALTHDGGASPREYPRLGMRLDGSVLCYDDVDLASADVRTDCFTGAPAEWLAQLGSWEVSSRWTCSPGWTWLSGRDSEYAMVQSKWSVEGDVFLDSYVGPKMMDTPAGRKEILQDLRIGVCGQPGFLNAGYSFLVGAKGGEWTALQRNGLVVAEAPGFRIPQISLHNDWFRFGITRQGGKVTLLCEGQPVLSYTDPDPLPGGCVSVGTYDNGVMVPRVTVYGDRIKG